MSQKPASKEQINQLIGNLDRCMQLLNGLPPTVKENLGEMLEINNISERKINETLYRLSMLNNAPIPPLTSRRRNISIYV